MTDREDQPPITRLVWVPMPQHPEDEAREVEIPMLPPEDRETFTVEWEDLP